MPECLTDECWGCIMAPALGRSTGLSVVMLHTTLQCLAQRKGVWPQNRCLFPTDGLQPQGHRAVIPLSRLDLAGLGK